MTEPTDDHIRLAEALIFANPDPVPARQLASLLPEDASLRHVVQHYCSLEAIGRSCHDEQPVGFRLLSLKGSRADFGNW